MRHRSVARSPSNSPAAKSLRAHKGTSSTTAAVAAAVRSSGPSFEAVHDASRYASVLGTPAHSAPRDTAEAKADMTAVYHGHQAARSSSPSPACETPASAFSLSSAPSRYAGHLTMPPSVMPTAAAGPHPPHGWAQPPTAATESGDGANRSSFAKTATMTTTPSHRVGSALSCSAEVRTHSVFPDRAMSAGVGRRPVGPPSASVLSRPKGMGSLEARVATERLNRTCAGLPTYVVRRDRRIGERVPTAQMDRAKCTYEYYSAKKTLEQELATAATSTTTTTMTSATLMTPFAHIGDRSVSSTSLHPFYLTSRAHQTDTPDYDSAEGMGEPMKRGDAVGTAEPTGAVSGVLQYPGSRHRATSSDSLPSLQLSLVGEGSAVSPSSQALAQTVRGVLTSSSGVAVACPGHPASRTRTFAHTFSCFPADSEAITGPTANTTAAKPAPGLVMSAMAATDRSPGSRVTTSDQLGRLSLGRGGSSPRDLPPTCADTKGWAEEQEEEEGEAVGRGAVAAERVRLLRRDIRAFERRYNRHHGPVGETPNLDSLMKKVAHQHFERLRQEHNSDWGPQTNPSAIHPGPSALVSAAGTGDPRSTVHHHLGGTFSDLWGILPSSNSSTAAARHGRPFGDSATQLRSHKGDAARDSIRSTTSLATTTDEMNESDYYAVARLTASRAMRTRRRAVDMHDDALAKHTDTAIYKLETAHMATGGYVVAVVRSVTTATPLGASQTRASSRASAQTAGGPAPDIQEASALMDTALTCLDSSSPNAERPPTSLDLLQGLETKVTAAAPLLLSHPAPHRQTRGTSGDGLSWEESEKSTLPITLSVSRGDSSLANVSSHPFADCNVSPAGTRTVSIIEATNTPPPEKERVTRGSRDGRGSSTHAAMVMPPGGSSGLAVPSAGILHRPGSAGGTAPTETSQQPRQKQAIIIPLGTPDDDAAKAPAFAKTGVSEDVAAAAAAAGGEKYRRVALPERLSQALRSHPALHKCVQCAARLVVFTLMRSLPQMLYEGNAEEYQQLCEREQALVKRALQWELERPQRQPSTLATPSPRRSPSSSPASAGLSPGPRAGDIIPVASNKSPAIPPIDGLIQFTEGIQDGAEGSAYYRFFQAVSGADDGGSDALPDNSMTVAGVEDAITLANSSNRSGSGSDSDVDLHYIKESGDSPSGDGGRMSSTRSPHVQIVAAESVRSQHETTSIPVLPPSGPPTAEPSFILMGTAHRAVSAGEVSNVSTAEDEDDDSAGSDRDMGLLEAGGAVTLGGTAILGRTHTGRSRGSRRRIPLHAFPVDTIAAVKQVPVAGVESARTSARVCVFGEAKASISALLSRSRATMIQSLLSLLDGESPSSASLPSSLEPSRWMLPFGETLSTKLDATSYLDATAAVEMEAGGPSPELVYLLHKAIHNGGHLSRRDRQRAIALLHRRSALAVARTGSADRVALLLASAVRECELPPQVDAAGRPSSVCSLLIQSHGGYGVAPFSGAVFRYLLEHRELAEYLTNSTSLAASVDGLAMGEAAGGAVDLSALFIQRLMEPEPSLLPLLALTKILRTSTAHNAIIPHHQAALLLGPVEMELLLDLMRAFAELSFSFSAAGSRTSMQREAGGTKGGVTSSSSDLGTFFFHTHREALLEWSCVVICDAAIGFAMDLAGPGPANFSLVSYDSTHTVTDEQADALLESPLPALSLPNVPFSRHNRQVAYSVLEKNRSVVLESLVCLKGELYYLLTGIDQRQTLLSIHRKALEDVKRGVLRKQHEQLKQKQQQQHNRTITRDKISADVGHAQSRTKVKDSEPPTSGASAAVAAATEHITKGAKRTPLQEVFLSLPMISSVASSPPPCAPCTARDSPTPLPLFCSRTPPRSTSPAEEQCSLHVSTYAEAEEEVGEEATSTATVTREGSFFLDRPPSRGWSSSRGLSERKHTDTAVSSKRSFATQARLSWRRTPHPPPSPLPPPHISAKVPAELSPAALLEDLQVLEDRRVASNQTNALLTGAIYETGCTWATSAINGRAEERERGARASQAGRGRSISTAAMTAATMGPQRRSMSTRARDGRTFSTIPRAMEEAALMPKATQYLQQVLRPSYVHVPAGLPAADRTVSVCSAASTQRARTARQSTAAARRAASRRGGGPAKLNIKVTHCPQRLIDKYSVFVLDDRANEDSSDGDHGGGGGNASSTMRASEERGRRQPTGGATVLRAPGAYGAGGSDDDDDYESMYELTVGFEEAEQQTMAPHTHRRKGAAAVATADTGDSRGAANTLGRTAAGSVRPQGVPVTVQGWHQQQPAWYSQGRAAFEQHRLEAKLCRPRPAGAFDLNTISPLIALSACIDVSAPVEDPDGVAPLPTPPSTRLSESRQQYVQRDPATVRSPRSPPARGPVVGSEAEQRPHTDAITSADPYSPKDRLTIAAVRARLAAEVKRDSHIPPSPARSQRSTPSPASDRVTLPSVRAGRVGGNALFAAEAGRPSSSLRGPLQVATTASNAPVDMKSKSERISLRERGVRMGQHLMPWTL